MSVESNIRATPGVHEVQNIRNRLHVTFAPDAAEQVYSLLKQGGYAVVFVFEDDKDGTTSIRAV